MTALSPTQVHRAELQGCDEVSTPRAHSRRVPHLLLWSMEADKGGGPATDTRCDLSRLPNLSRNGGVTPWPLHGTGPRHEVIIGYLFAMSRYEIMFDEWHACRSTRACTREPDDHGWGQGPRPVINISWENAQQYVDHLSRLTGKPYRLPSEAEWEYGARAGTESRYWWGDDVGENRANCRKCGSQWDGKMTAPVGSFAANPFGLFDLNGNVWEWTADCWAPSHDGAPTDGSARITGTCDRRAARGGSWYYFPKVVAATSRFAHPGNRWSYNIGVRVVRDME